MRSQSRSAVMAMCLAFVLFGVMLRSTALIAMALPLALVLLIGTLGPVREPVVRATWTIPETEIMEGEELVMTLTLENPSQRSSSFWVRVELPKEAELLQGRVRFPVLLRPGESMPLEYRMRFPHRGRFSSGNVEYSWFDLGRLSSNSKVDRTAFNFRVLPFIHPLDHCPLRPSKVRMPSGNLRSRIIGPGLEFHSLREYSPGDERRRINWKASARMDTLLVNQQHTERCGDVAIVIDARHEVSGKVRSARLVDSEVSAACSLAAYYLRQRDRVGVLVLGEFMDVIGPGYGKRQFHQIVEGLLNVRRGGKRSAISIPKALQRNFPENALVLVITPLDESSIVRSIKEMAIKGASVAVLVARPHQGDTKDDYQSYLDRLNSVSWEDDVFDLRSYCKVVEWDSGTSLDACFKGVRWS